MNRLLLFFLLLLPVSAGECTAAALQPPELWTAGNAVAFARRNSPDSQIARQRILEAEALLKKSAARFYPQVGLSGAYTQTNNPMYSFGNILNQGQFSPGIDFNAPGRTDNLNLTAGVAYRFYNGGQDLANRNAALAGLDLSAAEADGVALQLEFEVYRSFQQIIAAAGVDQARLAALDAARAALEVARARYAEGVLLKVDLLNLEVLESNALEQQIQSRHDLELAKQVFLKVLGLPPGDVRIEAGSQDDLALPGDATSGPRPELQQMRAALRAAESRLRAASGSRLPTVDGFASYQYDQGSVFDGQGDSWMAGVKVDFKLFDGQSARADVALNEARVVAMRAELRKLELALALDVRQAELALDQARQRLLLSEKMLAQATESEQLSRARFTEGVILTSDLIESETRLADARVRAAVASSARQIALANLRRAAGLPLFTEQLPVSVEMEK